MAGGTSADQAFAKFDSNNSGVLNGLQLQQCLSSIIQLQTLRPFSAKTVEYFLTKHGTIHANFGLCIDPPSFRALLTYIDSLLLKFRQLDVDNRGVLTCEKLHLAFQYSNLQTDAATINRLGSKYDMDRSGVLEFDEFCQFMVEWEVYAKVFQELDTDKNGRISVSELHTMLTKMQEDFANIWANQWRAMRRPFSRDTCLLLLRKFAGADDYDGDPANLPQLGFAHFGELLKYLSELKERFTELDANKDGALGFQELKAMLYSIGAVNPTEDLLSRIGRLYDKDANGVLEFDEFCQFTLEWEAYLQVYLKHAHPLDGLTPLGLQNILGNLPDICCFQDNRASPNHRDRYLFEGNRLMRDFSLKTCRTLVAKFSSGRPALTALEYMEMLEYMKRLKILFNENDLLTNGVLNIAEMGRAFSVSGLNISNQALLNIMSAYTCDHLNAGTEYASLHFDSFVQLRIELEILTNLFAAAADANGIAHLQFEQLLDIIYAVPRDWRDDRSP